ncbi:MAG: DegT/DnrJ/EryC1/StrS family aminotransferase [Thermodesulfobacteriota bacterium]|nr:DegT/DnrJ/EryC1/StrS family aminotransferase [Thermodesulfobacteriota bacterium]
MKVPLLDLKGQYATIRDEALKVTSEIYDSQMFILGPHVETLEQDIARYTQSRYAVGVSSGTDALLVSLMATGIEPGHRVLATPYTFFATAGVIARMGAIPVFVDIEPDTFNMDMAALAKTIDELPKAARAQCKAVIPVHLYGQCADMDPLLELAGQHNLAVIEDAAQAIGAEYKDRRAGAMGDFGCFSFFPSKNLGAFGDGGVVTVRSRERCERVRILRAHGSHPKYYHSFIGGNFRLDALQAAIVSIKLKHLDTWTEKRRQNAAAYRKLFEAAGLTEQVRLPADVMSRHIYNQFVISVPERRDDLVTFLREREVGVEIYYPVPLHLQKCFAYLGYQAGDFPVSEHAAAHTLALPIYPELTHEQLEYVVDSIAAFYKQV